MRLPKKCFVCFDLSKNPRYLESPPKKLVFFCRKPTQRKPTAMLGVENMSFLHPTVDGRS